MPTRHDRLDLVPGHSLGPFQLGSLLFNVLNHVRSYTQAYPHVDIAWDDQNSSTTDIFVVLATPPIHLSFEARSQRLYRIELDPSASYHLDSAADRSLTTTTVRRRRQRPSAADWVSYRGKLFRDPRPEPLGRGSLDRNRDDDDDDGDEDEDERDDVVRRIRTVLGPTHLPTKLAPPRSGDEEEEMLNYPGVALGITTGRGSRLKRIILTLAPNESTKVSRHAALASLPIASGDLDFVDIVLDRSTRIPTAAVLHFHSLATSSNRDERSRGGGGRREGDEPIAPVRLELGHTTHEDIVCQLGSSVRSFWKEDDRLSIHNVGDRGSNDPALTLNPYFLSYPHLGLTLMLRQEPDPGRGSTLECLHKGGGERGRRGGGGAHTLEKVILHSNLPGQINFGRTSRSNWRFALGQNDEDRRDDEQRTGETLTLGTTIGGDDKFDQLKQFLRGSTDGKDEGKQKEDRDESRSASTSRSPGRVSDDKSSANGRADEEESSPAETPKSDTTLALPSATLQVTGGGGVQTGGSIGSIGSSSSNKKKKKKGTTSSAGGNSTPPPPPSTSPLPSTSLHLSPSSEPPRTEADQIERSQDRARDSRGRDDDDDVLSRGTSRDEVERHVEEEETARGDRAVANSAPEKDDDEDEEPMILDRTATLTSPALVNDDRRGVRGRSEFGSTGNGLKGRTTELHGFPGIVLEVTKSRDVETVWLF